jgi:hypothetical protein
LTIEKNLEAGSEVGSRCLKCKDFTNHTILAMAEGQVAKVQCKVCGGRHNYRPATPEKPEGAKKKAAPRTSGVNARIAKAEAGFEALLGKRDPSKAKPYAMTATFKKGDLLDHPTFGLGVVTGILKPNKAEVQFRQETKILICVL